MENLRNNKSMPNDVGVIYNGKEQTRREKGNQTTKHTEMSQGKKRTT